MPWTTFGAAYPEQPALLDPRPDAIIRCCSSTRSAALAGRIRPIDVEYYPGDTPFGIDPLTAPGNGLSVQETIRRIEECGSWMVLKFVEQDEIFRNFLLEALAAARGGGRREDRRRCSSIAASSSSPRPAR